MLTVPLERLPDSATDRHATLRDYFCDKDATARRTTEGWALELAWPDGDLRHVDPRMQEGFDWWGERLTHSGMALAQKRRGKILTALYDTWTIFSWSEWLAKRNVSKTESLLILHVDDHRDVGSPRVAVEKSAYTDLITGESVSLSDPNSVLRALQSGAFGMGSILTPFLWDFPNVEVRHLCQPPKAKTTQSYKIVRSVTADTLLRPGASRPTISLTHPVERAGPGTFTITPDVSQWLADVPLLPTLLHIDMDYFNNRYDGDSDWQDREETLDPDIDHVLRKVDELSSALRVSAVARRIEDIVIAFSPGFFPAEYWRATGERLHSNLLSLP